MRHVSRPAQLSRPAQCPHTASLTVGLALSIVMQLPAASAAIVRSARLLLTLRHTLPCESKVRLGTSPSASNTMFTTVAKSLAASWVPPARC